MKRTPQCHNCIEWEYDDGFYHTRICDLRKEDTKRTFVCKNHEFMGPYSKTEAIEADAVGSDNKIDWDKVKEYYE